MLLCKDRVVVVTGAGRGIGRAYALMLARHGAKLVINDYGSAPAGGPGSPSPAEEVVAEVRALGAEAIADISDVADWAAARSLIDNAVSAFGRVDVLVNNAGILRDRMLVNMTEDDWDSVIRVHLKGTFAPVHHAANHWRARSKAGEVLDARIINTTSHSALFGNLGQANYAAAKAGIAALTIVAARELQRLGVTVNAIAPRANTRLTEGLQEWTDEQRDKRRPEWVAALVAWLASTKSASISGRVFEAWGFGIGIAEGWQHGPEVQASENPEVLGARLLQIIGQARPNAGIERGVTFSP